WRRNGKHQTAPPLRVRHVRGSTTTPVSVRDRAAARAQSQQQCVIGDELVLVLIRDRRDLLNEHLPARIDAEAMRLAHDLVHADPAPALVHIEDGNTEKALVGWRVGVAEGKPECRHESSPPTCLTCSTCSTWVVCCWARSGGVAASRGPLSLSTDT